MADSSSTPNGEVAYDDKNDVNDEVGSQENEKTTDAVRDAMANDLHSDDDGGYDGERAHSFRQRRLTYTRHHILSDSAAAAVAKLLAEGGDDEIEDGGAGDGDEGGEGEAVPEAEADSIPAEGESREAKKRGHRDDAEANEGGNDEEKLQNSNFNREKAQDDPTSATATAGPPQKKLRTRSNDVETDEGDDKRHQNVPRPPSTPTSKPKPYLPSRILHAGEIVRRNSPSNNASICDKRTGLHSHPSHPEYHLHNHHFHHNSNSNHLLSGQPSPANSGTSKHRPKKKWQTRFSFCNSTPDALLPFPRHIVGTYSCHGMEPVYDSDYENSDDDDDDDDDEKLEENEGKDGLTDDSDSEDGTNTPTVANAASDNNSKKVAIKKKEKATTTAKINQDRGGVAYPYGNSKYQALFACYDGHGEGGELVSQYALVEVQRLLEKRLGKPDLSLGESHPGCGGLSRVDEDKESVEVEIWDDKTSAKLSKEEKEEFLIAKAFRDVFVQVDRGLLKEEEIEPMYSGTTACVVLMRQNKLFISNVGDSRAVLARRANPFPENNDETTDHINRNKQTLIAIPLSIDQNPDSPGEKERILSSGGFVSPPPEPGLSARVWLDASHTQIGLAMARSIGDHAVKGVGVIAEPVVRTHTLEEDDEFIIIASDGVWEFISSEEAVQIVGRRVMIGNNENGDHGQSDMGASVACQALIKAASNKWHEYEGDYRDDITAIVIRLGDLWPKE